MEVKFSNENASFAQDEFEKVQIPQLPVFFTSGTHYEVGYAIGNQFSKQINTFCANFSLMKTTLLSYYDSPEGRGIFEGFLRTCSEEFPQYVEEIQGMSHGSGIPFEKLFLLNCLNEMIILGHDPKKFEDKVVGCTAVFINQPDLKILAHNEDHTPQMQTYTYIVSCKIDDTAVTKKVIQESREYITAYCYPGFLPGGTFGFNNHGMAFAFNYLYSARSFAECVPQQFSNRSLLTASSASQAVRILEDNKKGVASGSCCNMASTKDQENMWSVEIGPKRLYYLHTIPTQRDPVKDSHFIHVNNYQFLEVEEIEAVRVGSSANRYKRSLEMLTPKSIKDICTILGDTENNKYPIFRTPRSTDQSQTLVTAMFNILENKMDVYLKNPKEIKSPSFYLPMDII